MRIALFLNRDIHALAAANELLPELRSHTCRLFYSLGASLPTGLSEADLLAFAEREFPFDVVFPGLDQKGKRGRYLTWNALAAALGARAESWPAPNASDALTSLREWEPDLVVSVRYRRIFHEAFLAIPRYGTLNLHSAPLPDHPGKLGTLYALIAGEPEIGSTVHRIVDRGIDTGPLIGVSRARPESGRSLFGHVASIYPAGSAILRDAIRGIAMGNAPPEREQSPIPGAYRSDPTRADWESLRRRDIPVVSVGDLTQVLDSWTKPV